MDLRIVKTKKNIKEAFIKLRANNTLEKIRVTELCQIALINKTTFYKHYQDIYALADEVEDETILSIMNSFEHMDSLFNKPDSFVKGLYYAFKSHETWILTIFSGRINVLIDKVEKQLKMQYPAGNRFPEKDIVLSFLFRGASQVLMESKYDETALLDTVANITKHIIVALDF
ncbi:MAG: hypothetical protein JW908_04575 [Anaerolineales bacterium]|nr:hypothetical protein [Anaerolineales bacterium]